MDQEDGLAEKIAVACKKEILRLKRLLIHSLNEINTKFKEQDSRYFVFDSQEHEKFNNFVFQFSYFCTEDQTPEAEIKFFQESQKTLTEIINKNNGLLTLKLNSDLTQSDSSKLVGSEKPHHVSPKLKKIFAIIDGKSPVVNREQNLRTASSRPNCYRFSPQQPTVDKQIGECGINKILDNFITIC